MSLTKYAIEYNRVTFVAVILIALMGLLGYNQLARDSMPPFTIRVCAIVTQFPGASPDRVEALITDKIEKVAQELPELKDVTSESRTGLSIVSVTLKDDVAERELQAVWDRLRRKVESVEAELPDEARRPDIQDDGIGVVYGIMIGVENDGFEYADLKQYAEDIRDDIIKLPDASEVQISGLQDEQIYIEFDNARLAEVGLTSSILQSVIASTNIVFSGGEVSLEDERIILEPTGNFESLEDLEKTIITLGQTGESIYLGDITNITRAYKSPRDRLVKINGNPGLAISIALKDGANIINLGEQVDEKIAIYNQNLPVGIRLTRAATQDVFVNNKILDFVNNLIQAVGIVLAVMLLFLGLRTGVVVASLIPLAILMTLLLMNTLNIGLNQVSLAALIMALGMLVDNAIVVSESIMVKMEQGASAKDAAIDSSKELIIPLLVSSLTTSAAFLAFFLAESSMGEIMGPLFSVITLALLSSWLMAMTVVTMLAVYFIRVKVKEQADKPNMFDRLNAYYKNVLVFSLKRRFLFVVLILVLFFGSLMLFPNLPFIFFPDSDRNLVTLDLNLPLGTKIERTQEVVGQIEDFIRAELKTNAERSSGIESWLAFVAEGPESYDLGYQPGEANSGYAHLLLNTSSAEVNEEVIQALDNFCFQQFPDAIVKVELLSGGGGGGADVEVRVSGDAPEELFRISNLVKQKMNQIRGVKNISDDWGPMIKKFVVDIDEDKAQRAGLSNQDIAISLRTSLSGFDSGSFRDGEDNIPIMLRNEDSEEQDARELGSVNIYAQSSGANVPLVQVADVLPEWQVAKILRRNLYRTITISCYAQTGYTASNITDELTPYIAEISQDWKPGYTYELGGESENSGEAMGAVIDKLPIAGFIILLLLILQFNSFRKTFIVLSTIPLGLIGVILGLLLFKSYFGFMAFLGVISLAGIVINNAIVLLDRIQIELTEFNRSPNDAVVAAAQQRFRPILLTTFTTTLGLIPLYLGGGLMWEPMAIAIMIGLLFATVITLLFVPVLYSLLFRIRYR